MLKKLHLWLGIIFFIVFLLTGQYFRIHYHGLQNLPDVERLMLRSGHVYLFFAAFINIVFGLYWTEPAKIKWTTIVNQSLILLSPPLLTYSFVAEDVMYHGLQRGLGTLGVTLLLIWLINTAVGRAWAILKHQD